MILVFIGHHKIDVNLKGIVHGGKRADAAGSAGAVGRWVEGRGGDVAYHKLDVTPCCKKMDHITKCANGWSAQGNPSALLSTGKASSEMSHLLWGPLHLKKCAPLGEGT